MAVILPQLASVSAAWRGVPGDRIMYTSHRYSNINAMLAAAARSSVMQVHLSAVHRGHARFRCRTTMRDKRVVHMSATA